MSRIALYLTDPYAGAAGLIASARSARAAGHRIVTVASEPSGGSGLRRRPVLRKLEQRLRSGEFALIVTVYAKATDAATPATVQRN